VDATPPTSSVVALPAVETSPSFTVSWQGQDNPGGSGLASYNVYVSDNGGPFTLFQQNTTQTSALFSGVDGHTYGFYSVATDNVGNVQPTPTAAQPSTTVMIPSPSPSPGPAPAPTPGSSSPITLTLAGSHLEVRSTQTGQVLLTIRLYFGDQKVVQAAIGVGTDGWPDVVFTLKDKHGHQSTVHLDGPVLWQLAQRLAGKAKTSLAAALEKDSFLQLLVGMDDKGPVIDIFSGRTGNLLRQFRSFPSWFKGTPDLSMTGVHSDSFPDLIVTDRQPDDGGRFLVFDGRTLLAPRWRLLSGRVLS
jgi:hypothetical protein